MTPERASAQPPASVDRRDEILEAAIRAFGAKGYASVSLQEVADDLGISKAAIYYHFSKKQEILGEALDRAGLTLMARIRAVVAEDLPPSDALRKVLIEHISHMLAHRTLYSVYFSDASQLDAARKEALLQDERWYAQTVSEIVRRAIRAGDFREVDARTTTLAVLGMCNSTLRWFQPGHGVGSKKLATEVADMVLAGLRRQGPKSQTSRVRPSRHRAGGRSQ